MRPPLVLCLLLALSLSLSAQETLVAGNVTSVGYMPLSTTDYSQTFTLPNGGQLSSLRIEMHWDQASTIDYEILKTLVSPATPIGGPDVTSVLGSGSFNLPAPSGSSEDDWVAIDLAAANVQAAVGEILAIKLHLQSGSAGPRVSGSDADAGGSLWDHQTATPFAYGSKDMAFEARTLGLVLDDLTSYFEDFENGAAGWVSSSVLWRLGLPSQSYIDQAYSGAASWMTGLVINYPNGANATVTSGWFDLSAVTVDPVISLAITAKIAGDDDGFRLEIDRDDGLGWLPLGGSEWYESTETTSGGMGMSGSFWGPGERPWGVVANRMVGTAGLAQVRLRVIFASDPSVRSEGAAFDDIRIEVPRIVVTDASPYFEGFEAPFDAWSSTIQIGSGATTASGPLFERGSPAGAILGAAHEGMGCWGTNLDGNYQANLEAFLESAACDFSGTTEDPVLEFALRLAMPGSTAPGEDGLLVEMDLGDGMGFQQVGAGDWYDGNVAGPGPSALPAWTETSNGWRILRHELTGAAGLGDVRLRFRFVSDGSHLAEGVLIDDLRLFVPTFKGTETLLGDDLRMQVYIDGERELGSADLHQVQPGEQIEVFGHSPEGSLVGGEYYLVAEIFATGATYTNIVPDVWVSSGPSTVILQGGVQPPFYVPMQLGPWGQSHFYYYGGGAPGYSCRVQALVFLPAGALNGLYASADAFEFAFQ